jgi:hypothetical protein
MTFRFYSKRIDMLSTTECHSCTRIAYYSKQKMGELYPDDRYEVIGEIGNFIKRYSGLDEILTNTGKSIPIFPRGSFKKPFEWVAGYAAVGENSYVAVIKSVIPQLFSQYGPKG